MSARKTFDNAWSGDEISILRAVMPIYGAARVAKLTGRTHVAVIAKADRLGLKFYRLGKRPDGRALTDRLQAALSKSGPAGLGVVDIERISTGEKTKTVATTLSRMTTSGMAFGVGFRANRRYFQDAESAAHWDRNGRPLTYDERKAQERAIRAAARQAAREAALHAPPKPRKRLRNAWSDEETSTLRLIYPTQGAKGASQVLGRSVMAVTARAIALGVKCTVCVQFLGYVKAAPNPKAPKQAKPRKAEATRRPKVIVKASSLQLRPSAPKPPRERGPADFDGPLIFTPNTKYTFVPTPPRPLRTNTHSAF